MSDHSDNGPDSRGESGGTALRDLLALLDLERIEDNIFRGVSPKDRWQRVFGGQVLGQALVAAQRTVESRACHSLHGYFLRAGDPKVPILYEVDRSRDGASFSARRVVAIQHGQPIFTMSASFQRHEEGLEHRTEMPPVAPPEELKSEREWRAQWAGEMPPELQAWFLRERPIEIRPVSPANRFAAGRHPPTQIVWIRAVGALPDVPALHQCVAAYASDMTILDTSLLPHGYTLFSPGLQLASLDHAMWFHRGFRADDWLLYVQESPAAAGGRGFTRGAIYRRDGVLVGSVAQEGLIRRRQAG